MTDLYKEYATLELEFKALEQKRSDLRAKILAEMITNNSQKVETSVGLFRVAHKVIWTYSPALIRAEEQLKIKKMREQDKGVAKATETQYLLYNAPKV